MTVTRLLAAAVGLAVLLPAIVLGGVPAVDVVVAMAALVALGEYASMAFPQDRWLMGGVLTLGWFAEFGSALYGSSQTMALAGGLTCVGALMVLVARPGATVDRAADDAGRLFLGLAWVGLLVFLSLLRREDHGLAWVFLVLTISWLSDTGAYFAGRYFGQVRLYPKISPNKTWEGVAGGVILATMGTLVVREVGLPALSVVDCFVLGPVLSVVGVSGDLAESMFKRSFDVKDSGWIMPGHGGLLDRIDSLLFVAPLLYAWVRIVEA